jgi:FAD/FMN-containing dehydrogenase
VKPDAAPPAFNARFRDVRPAAVVSCASPQDVAEAIGFARRRGLELATRAGGHSFAGHSSTRGVLLDVTPMRSLTVAGGVARVGAGARLGEVYDALQAHDLTIPGGTCPPVGVAGLTLGGGLGILGRKHGVTSDHLIGAEIVLADGARRAGREPEGHRRRRPRPAPGHGRVRRVPWAAGRCRPPGRGAGRPGGLGPQRGRPDAHVLAADPEVLGGAGNPAAESGTPPVPEPPDAPCLYARSELFAHPLPAQAVDALLEAFVAGRTAGEERELDFMPWGGAYNRRPPDATAFVHRDQLFQLKHAVVVDASAPPSSQAAAHRAATRSWASVHPWGSGRVFQNFADPDLEHWADAYYGPNYDRLVRIKARYDPADLFRFQP